MTLLDAVIQNLLIDVQVSCKPIEYNEDQLRGMLSAILSAYADKVKGGPPKKIGFR